MISVTKVSKAYRDVRVLDRISLSFRPREVTALMGGNGAGKSTLLKILSGAVPPSVGEVQLGGSGRSIHSVRAARAAGIWMADQEGSLIPAWSVREHFARLARVASGEPWRRLAPAVDGRSLVDELPQLERQLVEIALVCTGGTRAALFDEPTAGMGPDQKRLIHAALNETAAGGASVIWVTHDVRAALSVAGRIVVLRGGEVVLDGAPRDTSREELMGLLSRERLPATTPEDYPTPAPGPVRFRIEGLPHTVPVDVRAGEIIGIVSGTGSPARDLFRTAVGLVPQGPLTIAPAHSRDAGRTAYLSRERNSEWDFNGQSLRFNLVAAAWRKLARCGVVDRSDETGFAETLRQRFSVDADSLDATIDTLSGGNRQKALLARLASTEPALLLLDEPFSGVDGPTRTLLRNELRGLAVGGTTVAIYSQELDDLIESVDVLVLIRDDLSIDRLDARQAEASVIEQTLSSGTGTAGVPE